MAARQRNPAERFVGIRHINFEPDEADNEVIEDVMLHHTWEQFITEANEDQLMSSTAKAEHHRREQQNSFKECCVNLNNHDVKKMGAMKYLPNEMFDALVDRMDFRTAVNFGLTCRHAHLMVHENFNLGLIMKRCPELPKYAARMHNLTWLNMLNVRAELLGGRECQGCGGIGNTISIFTGQRICFNCSKFNKRYCSVDGYRALRAFALQPQQLANLPYLHYNCTKDHRGVLIPDAGRTFHFMLHDIRELAVSHYGSMERMKQAGEAISPGAGCVKITPWDWVSAQWYRWMRQAEPAPGPNVFDDPDWVEPAACHGLASACVYRIPVLENVRAKPEIFYRCVGCEWLITSCFMPNEMQSRYMGIDFHLPGKKIHSILQIGEEKLRTKSEHLVHARDCIGAGLIIWNARASHQLKSIFR